LDVTLNILIIFRSICEKFGVSKAAALKSVRRVTKALINVIPMFISWPIEEKAQEIMEGFAAISVFPNVIGSLDGTHINIKAPKINPECYINRKGHYSV